MADKLEATEQREMLHDDLERQFQEVLAGLSSDGELAAFKEEYHKIYEALVQSHVHERKLGRKLRELNNELISNATKVQQALRLSEEDSAAIEDLKKQLEKSYALVESSNKKEEEAQQAIEKLQGEVGELTGLINKQNQLLGGELTVEDLLSQRTALVTKVNELEETLAYERKRADAIAADLMTRNEKQRELKAAFKELERKYGAKEAEEMKEARRKAVLEGDLQRAKEQLGSVSSTLESTKRSLADANSSKLKIVETLDQQRAAMTQTLAELHALQQGRVKLTDEIEEKMKIIDELHASRDKLDQELRKMRTSLTGEAQAKAKVEHKLAAVERELEAVQKDLQESKQEQAKLRSSLSTAEKELNKEVHLLKDTERKVSQLDRAKTSAEKAVVTAQGRAKEAQQEVDETKAELHATEAEIAKMSVESQKLYGIVKALERDRERLLRQSEDLKTVLEEHKETIRLKDAALKEAEKSEHDLLSRIKNVQGMYESMRAERNSASKAHMEAMDEIAELKRKGKVQGNQIESLKEDVHSKDKALVAEQFEASSLSKQLTARIGEVETLKRLLDEANDNNGRQEIELRELNAVIKKQDTEAIAQKRAFDSVVSERDVLSMQLQRRNDEIALLYEKVGIQQNTLKAGERDYQQRMDEMRALKRTVADLKRELTVASAGKGSGDELKKELLRLQRDLASEQNKVRALTEELENPLNVHRWRKLEGADPQSYELVQKVHLLQKRLIVKTEEVVEKDLALKECEGKLAEVQARLAAVPGPELAEQLTSAQALVNERTRQLKALASEVNMYQAQIAEYKYELERTAKEMAELKRHAHVHSSTAGTGTRHTSTAGTLYSKAGESVGKGTVSAGKSLGGGFVMH